MSTPATIALPDRPVGRPLAWWGVALLVVTESALFAVLLASLFYLRFRSPGPWPPAGTPDPPLALAIVLTGLVLAGSAAVAAAGRAVRAGAAAGARLSLAAAALLGVGFLAVEAVELDRELDGMRPQDDAFASLFYAISGLHGVHALVGVGLLAWALRSALRGAYGPVRHDGLAVAALYWHFVTAVWVVAFASLYLAPRL